MPIHVGDISRREMLKRSAALGAGLVVAGNLSRHAWAMAADSPAVEHWALLSDTHVAENLKSMHGGVVMAKSARQAAEQIAAFTQPLAGVLINGDCAYLTGQPGDYKSFASTVVDPLRKARLPIHITMGNHDHRDPFLKALSNVSKPDAVASRFASIVPGRFADWYILDSLRHTNEAPGEIGALQLKWLDKSLAKAGERPVIVMAHHPIERVPGKKPYGLTDSHAVWKVLTRHRQVKAYVYGHTHRWLVEKVERIHVINIPTTAYIFKLDEPRAWSQFTLSDAGIRIVLHNVGGPKDVPKGRRLTAELAWSGVAMATPVPHKK